MKRARPRRPAAIVAIVATAWTPPAEGHRHTARCPWPAPSERYRGLPVYVSQRERPVRPLPGPEALTAREIAAWVAEDGWIREGLTPGQQRACAYLATFAPRPWRRETRLRAIVEVALAELARPLL